ncbi:hypothetical protein ASD64_17815 [Mesorhizobium sp. Root157]|uniref:DUF2924 domain-containing protein n=1 Tax=Mesorhizobium sp. Root157 TaxID=1736477 RepID=UPI0007003840|nr:DUF2924 domain-containing protein [Mesorhizobium sp. Root157]KQZ96024.1 hypothetical protein ASD64_17815 [Mesorhizobium sp. Root157]
MRSTPDIHAEVAALNDLSRDNLAERWRKVYGYPPPKGARRDFLLRTAAWHLQAKRLGGLPSDTRRLLRVAVTNVEKQLVFKESQTAVLEPKIAAQDAQPRKQLSPGMRLVREWNGRSHIVDVLEEGFAFEGRLHKSLTAIAQQITGTHWSGPRFFGL